LLVFTSFDVLRDHFVRNDSGARKAEMEPVNWFDEQLRSTLGGFLWAVRQVPQERLYAAPPLRLGEWSAARHVFHMLHYEQSLALPSMKQWLGEPLPARGEQEDDAWTQAPQIGTMLEQFETVRQEQIDLLPRVDERAWMTPQPTTFWGEVSLYWIVCKTYQHTLDHTNTLLQFALFWDRILEQEKPAGEG
jgi:hypothetical protein